MLQLDMWHSTMSISDKCKKIYTWHSKMSIQNLNEIVWPFNHPQLFKKTKKKKKKKNVPQ